MVIETPRPGRIAVARTKIAVVAAAWNNYASTTGPMIESVLRHTGVPFVLIGFARAQIDLTPFGLPGCTQHVSINSSPYLGPPVGNVATYNMNIPADPSFAGLPISFQGPAINAGGATSVGAAVSAAIEAVVGVR